MSAKFLLKMQNFTLQLKFETFGNLAMVEWACSAVGEVSCVSFLVLSRNTQTDPFRDDVL